jgi:hypothetical protein
VRSCGWYYRQPQLVEPAVPQHDAFSDGAQHDACSVGAQQAELLAVAAVGVSCLGGTVVCCCVSLDILDLLFIHGLVE